MRRSPGSQGRGLGRDCRALVTDARVDPSESELQDSGNATAQHGRDARLRSAGRLRRAAGAEDRHDRDDRHGSSCRAGRGGRYHPALASGRDGSLARGPGRELRDPDSIPPPSASRRRVRRPVRRRLECAVDRGRPLAPEVLGAGWRIARGRQSVGGRWRLVRGRCRHVGGRWRLAGSWDAARGPNGTSSSRGPSQSRGRRTTLRRR